MVPTDKHGGGSLMFWGCFAASGTGLLDRVHGIMKSEDYQQILQHNVGPSVRKLGLPQRSWVFQQDNDPKHTSKNTRKWFERKHWRLLRWPAMSPDLNPIEPLWRDLKMAVWRRHPSNIRDLEQFAKEEWSKIPAEHCKKLIDGYRNRGIANIGESDKSICERVQQCAADTWGPDPVLGSLAALVGYERTHRARLAVVRVSVRHVTSSAGALRRAPRVMIRVWRPGRLAGGCRALSALTCAMSLKRKEPEGESETGNDRRRKRKPCGDGGEGRYVPPPSKRRTGVSFGDEHFSETESYIENGLRKVRPYFFDFDTYCKGRWVGKSLLQVFGTEFRSEPLEYYKRAAWAGRLRLNRDTVTDLSLVLKDNDFLRNTVHRHEPPVTAQPLHILAETEDIVVVDKPSSLPVHPCGRFRHNTVIFILGKEHNMKELHIIHTVWIV
ncbi:unnamed protein product [Ranitomeya imitator]|uniref:Tc1-like transposase DDE domain-containing protein n=1 Tax=Ranitomeya imitator TaxID=111125 RepID=A0ABN9L4M3_9NEOB|nr:unnamed protein product [Ranitomeya imitator]